MLCIMGWGDVKKKIKGEINKSHSMKSMTSDKHQSYVWPNGKKKREQPVMVKRRREGGTPQSCGLRPSTQPHSKVLQHCMIVYCGAEKSTPYYGNEGLSDDPKTWYRIPSLRRDRKGLQVYIKRLIGTEHQTLNRTHDR